MKKSKMPKWRARVTLHTMFAEVEVCSDDGMLAKQVALESVAGVFNDVPVGTGLLPHNTLFIQHAKAGARVGIYVSAGIQRLLTIQGAYVLPLPAFVLVGQGRSYELYAVKEQNWPSRFTEMYYPPLPNIFNGGGICSGEMTMPVCQPGNIWDVWEMVLGSYFTGHMTDGRCQSHKSIFDLWKEVEGAQCFPEEELVPVGKSLWDVMRGNK